MDSIPNVVHDRPTYDIGGRFGAESEEPGVVRFVFNAYLISASRRSTFDCTFETT